MRWNLTIAAGLVILAFSPVGRAQSPATEPATRAAPRLVSTTTPSDRNLRAHPTWYAACEKRVAAIQGQPCDILFIGDSITDSWTASPSPTWGLVGGAAWEKHYAGRHALNFGVGADGTQHVLWRMDHMNIQALRPKVAVILIGTNNTQNTPDETAAGVQAGVQKTQTMFDGVKVILISILPNARATQKMADANERIRPMADEKSIFYFDLASKLPKEGNSWKGLGRDRLHLTPEAYELWATEMEPLLNKLLDN